MSNSVTNVEIEDVLSSIRRLVSDGEKLRGDIVPPQADDPAEPSDEGSDTATEQTQPATESPVRFVLTAAHRVDQAEAANTSAPQPDEGSDQSEPTPSEIVWADDGDAEEPAELTELTNETPSWVEEGQAELDEIEAAADKVDGEGSVDSWSFSSADNATTDLTASDPANDEDIIAHDGTDEEPAGALILENAVVEDTGSGSWDDEAVSDPEPESESDLADEPTISGDRARLASTIAELEAAVRGQADDWEPDGSEETPVMDWADAGEEVIFSSRLGGPRVAEPVESPDAAKTEAEDIATDDVAEPQVEAVADLGDAEVIEDQPGRTRPEVDYEADAGAYDIEEPDALEPQLSAFLEHDDVLDEATLRQMVSDIVREELQGPLGERITRNVRKLVRREIYRALASRDYD